jgi:hypothetical protein
MIFRSALCAVLLISIAGCATVPRSNPEAEIMLLDAGRALDGVNEQTRTFYSELHGLQKEIEVLRQEPGWKDFEAILLYSPSLRETFTEEEVPPEALPLLEEWTKKWNAPWPQMLAEYQALADRCIILEARRTALGERILAAQAKYIKAAMSELSAGRYPEGKAIYGIVEMLDKPKQELDGYAVNAVGLY